MKTKAEQKEIALNLIEWALSVYLMKNFEQFTDINQKRVVKKMIEFDNASTIWERIYKFHKLNKKRITSKIIKWWRGLRALVSQLDKFWNCDIDETALIHKIMKAKWRSLIIEHIEKFKKLDHQRFLNQLFKKNVCVTSYLIEQILKNINKFINIDYQKLVLMIIDMERFYILMEHFEDISAKINHQRFVNELLQSRYAVDIPSFLEKFSNVDHQKLVFELLKHPLNLMYIPYDLEKFKWIDKKMLIEKIIDFWYMKQIKINRKKFTDVDQKWLTKVLSLKKRKIQNALNAIWVNTASAGLMEKF